MNNEKKKLPRVPKCYSTQGTFFFSNIRNELS